MSIVSRVLGWGMFLGVALLSSAARAQEKAPTAIVPLNTTLRLEMSKKQIIASVTNDNEKVCRLVADPKDPRAYLVTGVSAGLAHVTLTDDMKNTEKIDILVTTDDRAIREARAREFIKHVQRTVPAATGIDVLVSDQASTIIGTAPDAASRALIGQMASSMLGPQPVINAISLAGQEIHVNVPRVQQVELEVVVALVRRSELRRMSFNWVENRANYFIGSILGSTTATPLAFTSQILTGLNASAQNASGNPNLLFGFVQNRHSFLGFLEALRTEGLVKVLAEPRVVALSGKQSNIVSGGETPIVIATTVGSPPTIQYKPFGTTVEFTPVVLENGKIQLDVFAELSNKNDANGVNLPGVVAPGFDTRRARGTVHIEDCQTFAIGGLIQNTVNGAIKKVPILGDLPFLGVAFSTKQYEESEEELLILVTPRLVDPMACNQLPRRLPGRETRSPDDFELFLTGILEAPRGPREVCPDGHFRAAHLNDPLGIYPCGNNSGSCGGNRHSSGCVGGACNQKHGAIYTPPAMRNPSLVMDAGVPTDISVQVSNPLDVTSPLPPVTDSPVVPVNYEPMLPPVMEQRNR